MSDKISFALWNIPVIAFIVWFWWKTKDPFSLSIAVLGFFLSSYLIIHEVFYA